jgi:hypothetical protein
MSKPSYVRIDAPAGPLTVWWIVSESDDPPRISFHYADGNGSELGWHHPEADHVGVWDRYQECESGTVEYSSQSNRFESEEPFAPDETSSRNSWIFPRADTNVTSVSTDFWKAVRFIIIE